MIRLYRTFFIIPFFLFTSCASISFSGLPIREINQNIFKKEPLTTEQKQKWHLLDLEKDSIPGMSVERAYNELIQDKKGTTVIVAIIDSGVDIEHTALQNILWTNPKEIPGNNIDDDNNGYIDDIHGWNFLGESDRENLEYVRLLKKEKKGSPLYEEYEAKRQKDLRNAKGELEQINLLLERIPKMDSILQAATGKEDFTMADVDALGYKSMKIVQALSFYTFLTENELDEKKLQSYKKATQTELDAYYNTNFNGRELVGDDPDDINDRNYGNGNVIGPNKEGADHGTHVSGLVAAQATNENASLGVAKNVKIMVLRAVPDGDEYDKDIALAIRYAVDNGAQIINSSFGKGYSPHQEWITEALQHAETHDVLIVNAAGNDGKNIDAKDSPTFMTDTVDGQEVVTNFITVGATTKNFNSEQVADFSNIGMKNVDVFAPGEAIYSTVPFNGYEAFDGTSMAAPNVTGVAAVLRSFFPKYSASRIKAILVNSGVPIHNPVINTETEELVNGKNLAKSGKMVNLYNALLYASSKK